MVHPTTIKKLERKMMKVVCVALWLLASAEAVQFTPSFLDYSATEEKRESVFDQLKDNMAYSYQARRLSHTLPSFIVPRQCNYEALNHENTSTNPIDQIICPDQCGSGQDFTLRIATTCDRPYTQGSAVCSSKIDCYVDGCTDSCSNAVGGCPCPPVELLDINTALNEACNVLCVAAPTPVAAPVPAPVRVPVATPVATPVTVPVATPIATPVAGPIATPIAPVAGPVRVPVPGPPVAQPVASPLASPIPALPTPVVGLPTTPVFVPAPFAGPVVVPAPVVPVPGLSPSPVIVAPTPDLNCYSDTTVLLQDIVNADTSIVTTYSLCGNQVYNIGVLFDDVNGTTLTGGMAPLTARTNTHYICGSTGDVLNNCVLTGGEVQVLSAFTLYQEEVTNCRLQGFTFSMALQAGAALGNSGDITFQDCIFQVRFILPIAL